HGIRRLGGGQHCYLPDRLQGWRGPAGKAHVEREVRENKAILRSSRILVADVPRNAPAAVSVQSRRAGGCRVRDAVYPLPARNFCRPLRSFSDSFALDSEVRSAGRDRNCHPGTEALDRSLAGGGGSAWTVAMD